MTGRLDADGQLIGQVRIDDPLSVAGDPVAELATLLDVLGRDPDERLSINVVNGRFMSQVTTVGSAATIAARNAHLDCWYGTTVLHDRVSTGRGTAADVTGIRELFADLDAKPDGVGDYATASAVIAALADMLGTVPSAVVDSGHGLQPHWPLERGDGTDWTDETSPEWAAAAVLLRRWGRLVALVAERYGGHVDNVYDLPRVMRVPGTRNNKNAAQPVEVFVEYPGGSPVTLDRLREVLDEYAVPTYREDTEPLGEEVSAPGTWTHGERSCGYVTAMVAGWATDTPTARHPWLVGQATRLAAAHRLGCLTADDHRTATTQLADAFRRMLAAGEIRAETPGEVRNALGWGVSRVATKSDAGASAELGGHQHAEEATVDEEGDRMPGDSWVPLDLTDVVAGILSGDLARLAPTVGARDDGACLFYSGKVNGIAGASGSGKSFTAMHACRQEIAAGHHVVYVDLEDDPAGAVGRLLDMGAVPDDIVTFFHYIRPEEAHTVFAQARLIEVIAAYAPTLVVIDSTGEGMALDGAKPNDDDDTARWFRKLPGAVAKLGPAVLVLDHIVKADDGGLWPIGSQRKRAAVSGAQYMQSILRPFARDHGGAAKLVCAKDRHGTYRPGQKIAELLVEPDGDTVSITLKAPETAQVDGATFRPTALMERVSRYVETAPEPVSRTTISETVRGNKTALLEAVDILKAEAFLVVTPGPRKSELHTTVRPYRQEQDPRSDRYVRTEERVEPDESPSDPPDRSPTRSSLKEEERGTGEKRPSDPFLGTGEERVGNEERQGVSDSCPDCSFDLAGPPARGCGCRDEHGQESA